MKHKVLILMWLALTGCGSSQSAEPLRADAGDGNDHPVNSAAALPTEDPSVVVTHEELTHHGAVYAFSDSADTEPTTLEFTAQGTETAWVCQVRLPGNLPLTETSGAVACQRTQFGDDFLVDVAYPRVELPPRNANSPLAPASSPPAPPVNCTGDACSTTASNFDPSPPYPHVRILLSARVASEATIAFSGNGRQFELPVLLLAPADAAERTGIYLNVDDPAQP